MAARSRGPRKQLPFAEWPDADRRAWNSILREGDILDDARGNASHWSPATRRTNFKNIARFQGWRSSTGRLDEFDLRAYRRPSSSTTRARSSKRSHLVRPQHI